MAQWVTNLTYCSQLPFAQGAPSYLSSWLSEPIPVTIMLIDMVLDLLKISLEDNLLCLDDFTFWQRH